MTILLFTFKVNAFAEITSIKNGPVGDLAFSISLQTTDVTTFFKNLKKEVMDLVTDTFSFILDTLKSLKKQANVFIDKIRPVCDFLGFHIPTLGGQRKYIPLSAETLASAQATASEVLRTANPTVEQLRDGLSSIISAISDESSLHSAILHALASASSADEDREVLLALAKTNVPADSAVTILNSLPPTDQAALEAAVQDKLDGLSSEELHQQLSDFLDMASATELDKLTTEMISTFGETTLRAALPAINAKLLNYTVPAKSDFNFQDALRDGTKAAFRLKLIDQFGNDTAFVDAVLNGPYIDYQLVIDSTAVMGQNCTAFLQAYQDKLLECVTTVGPACSLAPPLHVTYIVCVNRAQLAEQAMMFMLEQAVLKTDPLRKPLTKKFHFQGFTDDVSNFVSGAGDLLYEGVKWTAGQAQGLYNDLVNQINDLKDSITATAKLVTKLGGLGDLVSVSSVTISGQLGASVKGGTVSLAISASFFGIKCCSPFSFGFSQSFMDLAKTVFNNFLLVSLQKMFKLDHSNKYEALEDNADVTDNFPIVEDLGSCWSPWNFQIDDRDLASNSGLQNWFQYISEGCQGNCSLIPAPNRSVSASQIRTPAIVNDSWYIYDFVCDAYYNLGYKITKYSDGSVSGFDVENMQPGDGPRDPNATVVSITFLKELPHYEPFPAPVDESAELAKKLAEFEATLPTPNVTTSEDAPKMATEQKAEPPEPDFSSKEFSGAIKQKCGNYTCSSSSLLPLPDSTDLECAAACTDTDCCYDVLRDNCDFMLNSSCPLNFAQKLSVSDLTSVVCQSVDLCQQLCCDPTCANGGLNGTWFECLDPGYQLSVNASVTLCPDGLCTASICCDATCGLVDMHDCLPNGTLVNSPETVLCEAASCTQTCCIPLIVPEPTTVPVEEALTQWEATWFPETAVFTAEHNLMTVLQIVVSSPLPTQTFDRTSFLVSDFGDSVTQAVIAMIPAANASQLGIAQLPANKTFATAVISIDRRDGDTNLISNSSITFFLCAAGVQQWLRVYVMRNGGGAPVDLTDIGGSVVLASTNVTDSCHRWFEVTSPTTSAFVGVEIPFPVNCSGHWFTGSCSVTCGDGIITDEYEVLVEGNEEGLPCEASNGTIQMRSCNLTACPVHPTQVFCDEYSCAKPGFLLKPNADHILCPESICTDVLCCQPPTCGIYSCLSSDPDIHLRDDPNSIICSTGQCDDSICCHHANCGDSGGRGFPYSCAKLGSSFFLHSNASLIDCPNGVCSDALCCYYSPCGDGIVDTHAGEQCEPPGEQCCNQECRFKPQGISCGGVRGLCNQPAVCTGASGQCPRDVYLPNGTPCRVTGKEVAPDAKHYYCQYGRCVFGGRCGDNQVTRPFEQCEPPNTPCCDARCKFRPATALCRPAVKTDMCDVADYCSGRDAHCVDQKKPNGVFCVDSATQFAGFCYDGWCSGQNPKLEGTDSSTVSSTSSSSTSSSSSSVKKWN